VVDAQGSSSARFSERLGACPQKNAAITWPVPVDARLDALVELLQHTGGIKTSRKDLAAAIIMGTKADARRLEAALKAYVKGTVGDAFAGLEAPVLDESNVVRFARHRPGPRSSSG
jgi:hypothetical protein